MQENESTILGHAESPTQTLQAFLNSASCPIVVVRAECPMYYHILKEFSQIVLELEKTLIFFIKKY